MRKILSSVLLFGLFACGDDDQSEKCAFIPDTNDIKLELTFESLEDSLPAVKTKPELVSFLSRYPEIRDHFFNRQAYPDDSTFINTLFNRFSHPAIDTLLTETHKVFGNGESLKNEFLAAFKNIKYYYPDFVPPKVQTMISGLETDVIVNDTLVIIGLDYFLGEDARFKPNMYEYMLKRYNKDFVTPSIVLLFGISERFNKTSLNDNTALTDMIAYGKAYTFTKKVLPCTPDSILIGYTKKDIDGAVYNESTIWKKMVEDQVLFSTSHVTKQKYIAERPQTTEISLQCPGRIGMWVGWKIVNKYLEETNKTLPDLMREADAQKIFKESKYRPGN
jgi:hypothetical protein